MLTPEQNFTIKTFSNSIKEENQDPEITKQMDEISKKTINLIFPKDHKMHIIAISITNHSNENVGYLYAIGTGKIFSLEYLYVDNTMRNSGIGTLLYKKALQQALEWKMAKMKLCTYEFQAPKFYEKLGFIKTGLLPNALDGNNLYYFEKELNDDTQIPNNEIPSDLQYNIFVLDNFNPLEFDNNAYHNSNTIEEIENIKNIKNIKKIQLGAVTGLIKYNTECLQSQDNFPREYHQFVISCTENKTENINGLIIGLILTGNPLGTNLIISSIVFDDNVIFSGELVDEINKHLVEIALKYNCKNLIMYENNLEHYFDKLGFSSQNVIPFNKIISL